MIYFILSFIWTAIFAVGIAVIADETDRAKALSITTPVAFVAGLVLAYFATPTIGVFYWGFWGYFSIPVLVIGAIAFVASLESRSNKSYGFISLSCFVFIGAFLIMAFLTTSAMFHSDKYQSLLKVSEEKDFDPQSVFLDQTQARFVDQDLAQRSANELMGQERGMASRFNVGTMNIQDINGELRWVAPFEHAGFTRWLSDSTSPGYADVSVNDYSDSKMVLTDSTEINIGVDGFYFSDYLPRYLYQNGYKTQLLDDYTIELDNEGRPHWVISIIEPQVGFSGHMVEGVVVVDAKTKEIEKYTLDEMPKWIDRAQPEWLVQARTSDWGTYVDGWWNAFFVGTNTLKSTRGSSLVFNDERQAEWYTGMRSTSSNNESTMGFMMVDSRTGEATYYQRSGNTEQRARTAMEGRVQEAGYYASQPIPYNINGITTFISIMKDKNDNVQGYGLMAYDDRSKVAFGETFDIALRRYMSTINADAKESMIQSMDPTTINGVVARVYIQNTDNQNILNFTLESEQYEGKFFRIEADSQPQALLTESGDNVSISVYSLEQSPVSVNEFNNKTLTK